MSQADIDWELCRSFLAVFREGNLSRAARALRLTQPTLGRHIDEIERVLGVVLFTRSPQGLTPTDAAFDLRPHAQAMAAAAEALVRAASGSSKEARGTVRITVPEWIGVEVLPPSLAGFHARYPGIIFELALTNRTEDLLRREADIGVRMVRLLRRPWLRDGWAIFASSFMPTAPTWIDMAHRKARKRSAIMR